MAKKDIFNIPKSRCPQIKLSLSKSYNLCPKNLKKAEKQTDVCHISAAGEKMLKKYEAARRNKDSNPKQISRLKSAVDEYREHKNLLLEQRKTFQDQMSGLPETTRNLIYRTEFQEFKQTNLWSDPGPHFKNADYLYSVYLELPQIFYSKKSKLNYFMENHGKRDVNGHFGVLSRWFKDIERNRYLLSNEDLVSAFREKAETSENIPSSSRDPSQLK
ncbi:hypothetical protein BB560_002866 [Smittium megazygosporum]|uniref:Uncharacterized protein n=1 Tax=Smittium megazygosporum TaxID=133381 RepID=A0A2T9ZDQ2_9FUNG|nr:hypothetical protein BB560_002866 [Smittium megazygosporum]